MNITRICPDLAKHVFQVHGVGRVKKASPLRRRHWQAGWGGANVCEQRIQDLSLRSIVI